MADLNVKLHEKQLEVFNDNHRFKILAAGRRFGKSRLAAWLLIIEALKSTEKDVFYVAPTYQQAKDILWGLLKEIGHDVIASAHENTSVLTLVNGRKIYLKGADRPDTLRGVELAFCKEALEQSEQEFFKRGKEIAKWADKQGETDMMVK